MIARSGLAERTRASTPAPSPAWPTTSNPERSSGAGEAFAQQDIVVGEQDPGRPSALQGRSGCP
jgi:hypothetical protein